MYNEFHELVTAILTDVHQMDPDDYSVTDVTVHRKRITNHANRVMRRIWGLRDWTFKYIDNVEILVPAESHVSQKLSADWVNEGRQGGLWTNFDPRYQVKWARAGALKNKIHTAPDETGTPLWYSVIGVTDEGTGERGLALTVFPKNTMEQSFLASYEIGTPRLTDGDPGDVGNIDALPEQWRHVLYEWTAAREHKSAGEVEQYKEQMLDVQQSLFDMVSGEAQGKPGQEFMPPYPGAPVEVDWMDW